jgi:hypothetical protein
VVRLQQLVPVVLWQAVEGETLCLGTAWRPPGRLHLYFEQLGGTLHAK